MQRSFSIQQENPLDEDDIDRGVPTMKQQSEGIGDPIFSNGTGMINHHNENSV